MHRHDSADSPGSPSRRQVLKSCLSVSAGAVLGRTSLAAALEGGDPFGVSNTALDVGSDREARPYLEVARKASRWLAYSAQRTERGTAWPSDPRDATTLSTDLYNGMPGVVLFYLELFHATGDKTAIDEAKAGADYIVSSLPRDADGDASGLYTGLAGMTYVLALTQRASGEARYRDAASRALGLLKKAARPVGRGVEWSESTDIISGSAGIGLLLLWAREHMKDAEALDLAVQAGRRLVERGQAERGGLKWTVSPKVPRNYPNFSHGTAGVSYFLATLHGVTKERAFLDAAKAGAAYLEALATPTPNGGRMVFHSEPGNERIFYLSWCHGPAGTARLYHRLALETGEPQYDQRVANLAQAIIDMRVPERSPGFWNNISQCCGNSGVVEFFLDLHRRSLEAGHLSFAERVSADTLARATQEADGLKWVQAEHRVQPDLLIAQTGLMQGAARVGIAMLHLDGAGEKRAPFVVLPDNPF